MLELLVLAMTLLGQSAGESPFNTYGVSLLPTTMPGACAPADESHFANRAYRFRDTPMYPHDEPLVLVGGRAVERNGLGSVEWESTLRLAAPIALGTAPAVLLEIEANHVGGTGSIRYVLVVQCQPDGLRVLFEARGPITTATFSGSALTLTHGVWSRNDSHASPSREVTERYDWAPGGNGFVLVRTTERRLREPAKVGGRLASVDYGRCP